MEYEDMSDFEVNKLVAEKHLKLFVNELRSGGRLNSDVWLFDSEGLVRYTNYNPCNNPSDAWPIIIDNKISITHSIALYRADALVYDKKFDNGFKIFNQDSQLGDTSSGGALRAAMICFLKMKDAQK